MNNTIIKNNKSYPQNLIDAMQRSYSDTHKNTLDLLYIPPQSLEVLMTTYLSEKEQDVIIKRWKEHLTLDEVGKIYEVTRERVRQIEAKAMRVLYFHALGTCTYVPYEQYKHEQSLRQQAEKIIDKLIDTVKAIASGELAEQLTENLPIKSIPIEDMSISVRSYNCLKRAGYDTVGDIVDIPSEKAFTTIRNLGKQCSKEIINKIHDLGLQMKWERQEENQDGQDNTDKT